MAPSPPAARPVSHGGDGSQPGAEASAQDSRRCPTWARARLTSSPIRGLGPRAAQRPGRGTGATASPRGPRHRAPMPVPHGRTRFIHRGGQPARPHICSKRPKRPRTRRCRARASARAHDRRMGSSSEEGLRPQLSQPDQDADLPEDTDAARPPAAPLQEGDQQPPSPRQGPFFYIGGTNGASLVSSYCKSKGWQRTHDGRREDLRLKWCEIKCRDSYHSFREGQQLLFQLPNNKLLTTKIGLLSALREHARAQAKVNKAQPGAQAK